ncbi:MAG TPA: PDZ domain-containing protein [Vicinamibacterales bacterium]|nr:PDZ domain-containing protein [Vicinamibacterales bacterium]
MPALCHRGHGGKTKKAVRIWVAAGVLGVCSSAFAQAPVTYHLSFPEAQHHRMQVEVTFADVPAGALEVVMSQASPGRYALHGFAKNVFDVEIEDGNGAPLRHQRPNTSQWDVPAHNGAVRVRYKVFGDQVDGTFLGIDSTHAHINIPAALMWAKGFEGRPVRVTFDGAPGWKVATQLHSTSDPRTFTAPNLQYLIDSPTELSNFTLRTFRVGREFRIALHHDGSEADADRFAAGVEKLVREERAIFGELPAYEVPYTFIADFLSHASSDAMEHRNSTILTSSGSLQTADRQLEMLSTAAHEFFHSWNVERIRPASLEPFRLDAPNPSGELWFGEGFTTYYEQVTLHRAGLWSIEQLAARLGHNLDTVIRSPARKYISAEEGSRLAQFIDQASWSDPTNLSNTSLSYYEWGAAIGLGLDLSLRARSDGNVTLDEYMRRLWREFGRPMPTVEGTVPRPYTVQDLRQVLADVSGDRRFASEFFDRYVHGREVVDYRPLLARAGLLLRKSAPGRPWIGPIAFDFSEGVARIGAVTIEGTPAYAAGLDRGDVLLSFEGTPISDPARLDELVQRHRPGDRVRMSIRRRGVVQDLTIEIAEDPHLQVVPVETTGRPLAPAERAFRHAWLGSQQ